LSYIHIKISKLYITELLKFQNLFEAEQIPETDDITPDITYRTLVMLMRLAYAKANAGVIWKGDSTAVFTFASILMRV